MSKRNGEFESEAKAAYPALARAAAVLCSSRSDVEDVVQETMIRAFKSYPTFRGDASFMSWTYRILARVAQANNQKRSRRLPDDITSHRPDPLPPVDRTLIANEEAQRLVNAIRSLPNRQREVVTLHFLEQLPYAKVAQALDISVGTVKATIFAAKMSLRSALNKRGISRKGDNGLS